MQQTVNYKEVMLDNILAIMSNFTFSKAQASIIVGGDRKLNRLIEEGKVASDKTTSKQNGKWYCNAAQVLMHCRDMRAKIANTSPSETPDQ